MAERTVNIAGITYRSAQNAPNAEGEEKVPVWPFAMRGEVVDVHESDLVRFDSLNDIRGAATVTAAFRGAVAANNPPGPQPLDHGAGAIEDPQEAEEITDLVEEDRVRNQIPARPRNRASLAEWQDYAEAVGVELQDEDGNFKTKAELIEEADEEAPDEELQVAEDPSEG
jgi:hypothetical protein